MRNDHRAENQHYVPKLLLRRFAGGKSKGQVRVFDKHSGRQFPSAIDGIAGEGRYYDALTKDQFVSLEPALTQLEGDAAPALARVIEKASLASLSAEDRAVIAVFAAVQFARTPRLLQAQKQLHQVVLDKARAISSDPAHLAEFEEVLKDENLRLARLHFTADSASLAPIIHQHHWMLLSTKGPDTFWISDSPVVLHNYLSLGPYGNLGLAVPGIQIYLPLSPHLCLAFWDRGVMDKIRTELEGTTKNVKNAGAMVTLSKNPTALQLDSLKEMRHRLAGLQDRIKAMDAGGPMEVDGECVTFQNWLQYRWSYRFLISSDGRFDLAEKIRSEHPELNEGVTLGK